MSSTPESGDSKNGDPPKDRASEHRELIRAVFAAPDPPTKTDLSAAILERALRHESDERKTERFYWILAVSLLSNVLAVAATGWILVAFVPLQLIMLLGLAHWLEVDFIKKPLQQLLDRYLYRKDSDG